MKITSITLFALVFLAIIWATRAEDTDTQNNQGNTAKNVNENEDQSGGPQANIEEQPTVDQADNPNEPEGPVEDKKEDETSGQLNEQPEDGQNSPPNDQDSPAIEQDSPADEQNSPPNEEVSPSDEQDGPANEQDSPAQGVPVVDAPADGSEDSDDSSLVIPNVDSGFNPKLVRDQILELQKNLLRYYLWGPGPVISWIDPRLRNTRRWGGLPQFYPLFQY